MTDYIHKGIKKQDGRMLTGIGILCFTKEDGVYDAKFLIRIKRSLRNDYVTCSKCLDIMDNKIFPTSTLYCYNFEFDFESSRFQKIFSKG